MKLSSFDVLVISGYLCVVILLGMGIARFNKKNTTDYFLGQNKIPWPFLGLSNASGMFDISGTMWMVYLLFIYGLKSFRCKMFSDHVRAVRRTRNPETKLR